MIQRRPSLALAALCAVASSLGLSAGVEEPPARRPNLVLLVADDLGYGDVGYQGSAIPTPHIDGLAAQGVRFSAAYVNASTCSPSRAALLTGRYPQRLGFEFNTGHAPEEGAEPGVLRGLAGSTRTLADDLRGAGYATAAIGKWHLGLQPESHPLELGFDEFFGFLEGEHPYLPGDRSYAGRKGRALAPRTRGAKGARDTPAPRGTIHRGRQLVAEPAYLTEAFAREAVDFVRRQGERPFFLYVPFSAPHTPLDATRKYRARFAGVPREDQTYRAMVSALDDAVGSILAVLEAEHLERDTLVVFLSDNGAPTYVPPASNAPLRLGKQYLFEGGIRVPLVARWTGTLPAGAASDAPVSALDLAPTLRAAAGLAPAPRPLADGHDLLPYLRGEAAAPPAQELFWRCGETRAARLGRWKLVEALERRWLFDLSGDASEAHDLAGAEPEVVLRLLRALDAWEAGLLPPAWPPQRGLDAEVDGDPYPIYL